MLVVRQNASASTVAESVVPTADDGRWFGHARVAFAGDPPRASTPSQRRETMPARGPDHTVRGVTTFSGRSNCYRADGAPIYRLHAQSPLHRAARIVVD